MANFPNLMSKKFTKVQEAQRVPIKMNPKRTTQSHTIIKMAKLKDKERILNAAREKQEIIYKRFLVKITAKFSTETLQARGNGKKYSM